jgi:hypothetical protein
MRHTFMQPQVFRRLELLFSLWLVQSGIKCMLILSVKLSLLSRAPHHLAEQNKASLGTAGAVE